MFDSLPASRPDAILGLMAAFREDSRANKTDLGVGIYKDTAGNTPVMRAIKLAEKRLLETQDSKSYVSPLGSTEFCSAMVQQVFGASADLARVRCAQAPGGSGALRILADLMHQARPTATVWVSDPSWPNHIPLLSASGYSVKTYPYYDTSNNCIDIDNMLASLASLPAGDIVVLHGCCHNPTGADLNAEQWQQVADICRERSLLPFIDIAYQGFGDGLEEDAAAVRLLASQLPELVVAASCSKNFGLYRERVGAALLLAADADAANLAIANLGSIIRANYSMPPDHGANVTQLVLSDADLSATWKAELGEMRKRMQKLREDFAAALRKRANSEQFDYIARQKGMFSRLPLTSTQIDQLRVQNGIYIVGDGRINVAGLPADNMDGLAEAIVAIL